MYILHCAMANNDERWGPKEVKPQEKAETEHSESKMDILWKGSSESLENVEDSVDINTYSDKRLENSLYEGFNHTRNVGDRARQNVFNAYLTEIIDCRCAA